MTKLTRISWQVLANYFFNIPSPKLYCTEYVHMGCLTICEDGTKAMWLCQYSLSIMLLCATIYTMLDLGLSQYSWQILSLQRFDHTLVIFFRQLENGIHKAIYTCTVSNSYLKCVNKTYNKQSMCSSLQK